MARRESILKYLTPNTPATELDRFKRSFCIPNDAQWLGVFMGAIYPLTLPESWELHGSVTPEQAAEVFQEIFNDAFYETGECDMSCCPLRYTETGLVEQYNPETEEYEPIAYPAVPARTPVEGQDTQCLAAANATEVMRQLWDAWKETWDTSTFLVAVAGIITIIGLLIFYPVALPAVITFFSELYGLMVAIGADDFDADKQDIFMCILYNASSIDAGVVTFDFDEVVSEVDALWTPVTDINVWAGIHYLLLIIGEDGLNRAGTTTSITEADCACAENWCYYTNFAVEEDPDWSKVSVAGAYVATQGWRGTGGGSTCFEGGEEVEIEYTLPAPANITKIYASFGSTGEPTGSYEFKIDGTIVSSGSVSGTGQAKTWTGAVVGQVIRLRVCGGSFSVIGDASMEGSTGGFNFGVYNCE